MYFARAAGHAGHVGPPGHETKLGSSEAHQPRLRSLYLARSFSLPFLQLARKQPLTPAIMSDPSKIEEKKMMMAMDADDKGHVLGGSGDGTSRLLQLTTPAEPKPAEAEPKGKRGPLGPDMGPGSYHTYL